MKINYVLLYGTPYLRYELFNYLKDEYNFLEDKGYQKWKDSKRCMVYR